MEHPATPKRYSREPHILPVSPASGHGKRYPFLLSIPADHSHDGKRVRRYFATEAAAKAELARCAKLTINLGRKASTVSPAFVHDALQARKLLDGSKQTTSFADIVKEWLAIREIREQSVKVADALSAWADAPTPSGQERRKQTQIKIDALAKLTKTTLGDLILTDVRSEQIVTLLDDACSTPGAFNKRLALFGNFLRFAERRGWVEETLLKRILSEKRRTPARDTKPGILTPSQFSSLLDKAAEENLVDYLAVLGLAGVRPEEASLLTFGDFSPDEGEDGILIIPDGASKTRKSRDVPIEPALKLWLSRKGGFYERAGKDKETPLCEVQGDKLQKALGRIRNRAGWKVNAKGCPTPQKDAPVFPPDSLRHTFASAYLGRGGDVADLIFQFGHATGLQTLRRHYLHRYNSEDSQAWFSVVPVGAKLPPTLRVVEGGKKDQVSKKRQAKA